MNNLTLYVGTPQKLVKFLLFVAENDIACDYTLDYEMMREAILTKCITKEEYIKIFGICCDINEILEIQNDKKNSLLSEFDCYEEDHPQYKELEEELAKCMQELDTLENFLKN